MLFSLALDFLAFWDLDQSEVGKFSQHAFEDLDEVQLNEL